VHPSACSALFLALLAAIESALGASMLKTSLANAPVIVLTQLPCQEVRIENRPCCNFISMPRARTTTGSGTKKKKKKKQENNNQQRQLQQVNNNSTHTCLPLAILAKSPFTVPNPNPNPATWRLPGVKACCQPPIQIQIPFDT